MVDEQALADLRARVDLDARLMPSPLADPPGQKKVLVLVQPVCYPVIHQNVEPRVEQNHLQHTACGGVFPLNVSCVLQQTHEEPSFYIRFPSAVPPIVAALSSALYDSTAKL